MKEFKLEKENYTKFVMNCARKKSIQTLFFKMLRINGNYLELRKLFSPMQKKDLSFPEYDDPNILANDIGDFFIQKIDNIRNELDSSTSNSCNLPIDEPAVSDICFDSFNRLNEKDVTVLTSKSNKKTSSLDTMFTSVVAQCQNVLVPVIQG